MKFVLVILPLVLTTTTAQKDDIDLERLVKLYKTAKSVGYDFSKVDFNKVGKQFTGGLKASDIASLKSTNPELSADLEEIIQVAQRQQSGDVEALPVRTKESALAEIAALPVPRAPAATEASVDVEPAFNKAKALAEIAALPTPRKPEPVEPAKEVEIIAPQPKVEVKALPLTATKAASPPTASVVTLPSFSPLKSAFAAPALKAPEPAVVYDTRTQHSYIVGLRAAGPPFSTHIVPTYGPQSTPFYAGYAAAYPHQYYGLYSKSR